MFAGSYEITPLHRQRAHETLSIRFFNVARRKFGAPLTLDDCLTYLKQVLAPRWQVSPTVEICIAALEAGCGVLYSQDLQNGQQVGPLTIADSFV